MFGKYDKQLIKNTVNMAWPVVIESFFTAFVGLVDSYMVSGMGHEAMAAVGLTTQPKFMGLSLFFALNVSVSALVARRRGEKRREDANSILFAALAFILATAVLLSVLFVFCASPIIRFCGSNEETHDLAVQYFRIIMGGMIFNCISMGINSAQRGAGNTRITMRTNVTSNIVNVIFNYLLINGKFGFPRLEVRGAAIATVLGTVVACGMSIYSVMDKECFVSIPFIIKEKIRPTMEAFRSIIKVGYSVFFEQILMRIGFMLTAIMAAKQGTAEMAAHQVGMNIMGLSFSFGDGLQATAVALIGRSLGEKNKELAKEYGRTCRMLGGIISVVLLFVYFFGARPMMRAFFREEYIVDIGVSIMRVVMFVVLFQIAQVIYMGCLRGAGDTLYTAIASIIGVTIVRTGVSYLGGYVLGLGIVGIWSGVLADQVARFVLAAARFKQGKWTEIKI
ncbi:MAG: MATE family efflux transporter [Lachnospiraceae bacterium]|nr:MATE family efflux transporter [Lachnospiraceae bacterium]